MIKTKPGKGYSLMILGAGIYFVITIITLAYTPEFDDLNDYLNYSRLMATLVFFGVLMFMYGSILEIKEIWLSFALLAQGNKSAMLSDKDNLNESEPEYFPKKKSTALDIALIFILFLIIIIIAFLLMSSGVLS
ncbi:MAG: hypothetical protein Q7J68_00005 [Thermoplasmata archaeon]|nr:hypothetical protein [Thermoplasmata archaeon]